MNSLRIKIVLQHLINQLTGTWALPSEEIAISESAAVTRDDWRSLCIEYLILRQNQTKRKALARLRPEILIERFAQLWQSILDGSVACSTCIDSHYPAALRHIPRFPLLLFVQGSKDFNTKHLVGIVGARKASREALAASYDLGFKLAKNGYCIVSGGAFGCDAAAHLGAVESGVPASTVAVFASSADNPYPRHLQSLFLRIINSNGALISERLPGTRPHRIDFPVRNRIIAGMVEELHVMQAGESSGAMITANLALDFGREVRVWNPSLNDIRFVGNARLLSVGAENSQTTEKLVSWQSTSHS